MALRARMELERLRAEKEDKEQRAKADADARERSKSAAGDEGSQQHQPHDVRNDGEGVGYEPDGYGRDDPYSRQEDVETERAPQPATAAASSPATVPVSGERSGSGWGMGAPPPKARPTPKAVLGRGQEEAVEAGTGARVIQKRQVPPAAVLTRAPQERGPVRQLQAPSQRQDAPAMRSEEAHAKAEGESSHPPFPRRHVAGAHVSGVADAGNGPQALGEKGRRESSSVSLQWLTPRRDSADTGGETHSPSQRAGQAQQKAAPSAWEQPSQATPSQGLQGVTPGANGPLQIERSRGRGPHDRPAGGGTAPNLPPRSPHVRSGEIGNQFPRQDVLNSGHDAGKAWPAPGNSPGPRPAMGGGGSFGQPPQGQPPPSPFGKEAGRSFSSLFAGPGQHEREGVQRPGSVGSGGGGFSEGHAGGEELGRDWPEAGRGPPPREHKRIFDHKTGKMRDVEVRVGSSGFGCVVLHLGHFGCCALLRS